MNKTDLVEVVVAETGVSKKQADAVISEPD